MNQALVEQIETILKSADDMTIATIREDGFPQATTVSYVCDGRSIYFWCGPDSQKVRNISRNPKVSATVNLLYADWNEIKGVSMGALAERVTDPKTIARLGDLMVAKFPLAMDLVPETPSDLALIRVTPKVVSLLDYTKGFGHTELVTF